MVGEKKDGMGERGEPSKRCNLPARPASVRRSMKPMLKSVCDRRSVDSGVKEGVRGEEGGSGEGGSCSGKKPFGRREVGGQVSMVG